MTITGGHCQTFNGGRDIPRKCIATCLANAIPFRNALKAMNGGLGFCCKYPH